MGTLIYGNIFILSAIISLLVTVYVFTYTRYTVYRSVTALMLAVSVWSLFYGFELLGDNYNDVYFFIKFQYVGIVSIPVFWLLFAARYTGRDTWINIYSIASLCIVPIISLFMVYTNSAHSLFYKESELIQVSGAYIHKFSNGLFYWVHIVYSYLLVFLGVLLVLASYMQSTKSNRIKSGIVLLGSVIPFVFSVIYIMGFKPQGYVDLTPIGFLIMGLIVVYGVKTSRLFDLKPLLLNSLFDSLPDAIFAVDAKMRIITTNPKTLEMIEKGLVTEDGFLSLAKDSSFIYNSESDLYFTEFCSKNQTFRIERTDVLDRKKRQIGFLYILVNITQEEQYREALKKSEEQYRLLFDNAQEGIVVIKDRRLVFFNPMFQKLSGFESTELISLNIEKFIFEEDKSYMMELYDLFLKNPGAVDQKFTFRFRTKEGSICWVEFSSVPIVWNGQSAGLLFMNNINEKKQIEELKELLISISNTYINAPVDRFVETVNSSLEEIGRFVSADRSYVFDYDWEQNLCNNTFEWCNKGIEPEIDNLQNISTDLIPQWVDTHKLQQPMFVDNVQALAENDPLREILEPQGIKSLITIPMFDGENCIGFVGFDSVLSFHKYSEKEKVLLQVFAQMIVNLQSRWLANEKIKTQIALQRLVNEISTEMISADNNSIDAKIMSLLSKTGEFFEMDRSYIMRYDQDCVLESITHEWCAPNVKPEKESIRNVNIRTFPWWNKLVKSNSVIHIEDCTALPDDAQIEKKEFERQGIKTLICFPIVKNGMLMGYYGFDSVKKIYKWADQQKEIIEVLTNILGDTLIRVETELELIRSKDLAEAASVAKSNFLSNMSHEIRTPLNGVIGFTELLRNTTLTKTQKDYLDNAINSANTLLGVISDILDFSKIESGKLEIETVKTDIIQLFEASSDIVKVHSANKGLELLLNIDPSIPRFAYIDPIRIKQILVNLLSNSVKFTHVGEIELSLNYKALSSTKGIFSIAVRDTGIGIKDEDKHKLFKAFSQADTSTTRRYGGTGLGLIISNSLAEKMGSRIQFESEYGKGTRFFFELECDVEFGEALNMNSISNINKVLIVDDNANNRRILEHTFKFWNIDTESSASGQEAIEILKSGNKFDLIIVDYHMPVMDGIDTIRIIREEIEPDSALQPIIMLHSSSDDLKVHENAKELNISYMLTKPVKQAELYYYINGIVYNKAGNYNNTGSGLPKADVSEGPGYDRDMKSFNVLVAEDTPMNMLVIENMLKIVVPSVKLFEAGNGIDAIQLMKKNKPDLVLMDVQMPELDGLEATKQIRKLPNGLTVPIIALTAGVSKEERELCFKSGMDDFLSKPIEISELKRIIAKYYNKEAAENSQISTTTAKTDQTQLFDRRKFESKIPNPDIVATIVELCKTEFPKYISEIEDAIIMRDSLRIKQFAHKLKGGALNMEFEQMSELCVRIEEQSGDIPKVDSLLTSLKDTWLRTLDTLNN